MGWVRALFHRRKLQEDMDRKLSTERRTRIICALPAHDWCVDGSLRKRTTSATQWLRL